MLGEIAGVEACQSKGKKGNVKLPVTKRTSLRQSDGGRVVRGIVIFVSDLRMLPLL